MNQKRYFYYFSKGLILLLMVLKVKRFNFIIFFYNALLQKTSVPSNDSYSEFTNCKTFEIRQFCYTHGVQLPSLEHSMKQWLLCNKQCSVLVHPKSVDRSYRENEIPMEIYSYIKQTRSWFYRSPNGRNKLLLSPSGK